MTTLEAADLQIDVFRSGVNTPTSVRITHRPTGKSATAIHPSQLIARHEAMWLLDQKVQGRTHP